MTPREQLLAQFFGEKPDRIPFYPRMQLWHMYHRNNGTLPQEFKNDELWDVYRRIGVGIHHFADCVTETVEGVEIKKWMDGFDEHEEYHTPAGVLTGVRAGTEYMRKAGYTVYYSETPFKSADDFAALEYIYRNTKVAADYEEYERQEAAVGEDGIALCRIGRSALRWLDEMMGFERMIFELADHPREMESLIEALNDWGMQIIELAVRGPGRLMHLNDNITSFLFSPPLFKKYMLPYYQRVAQLCHEHGKKMVVHTDGEMKALLHLFLEAGVNSCESFTPAPMTDCTLAETLEAWGDDIIIWGGVPSSILVHDLNDEEFEAYMKELFRLVVPRYRFIMSIGDNVMPEADYTRVLRIRDWVEEYGRY